MKVDEFRGLLAGSGQGAVGQGEPQIFVLREERQSWFDMIRFLLKRTTRLSYVCTRGVEWRALRQPQPGYLSSNHRKELSKIYKTPVKVERTDSRLTSELHVCTMP